MDKCIKKHSDNPSSSITEEVSSSEWKPIKMSKDEEDIINIMHKLVGDRWGLIAGRVPGRKAEEVERFWLMRNSDCFRDIRNDQKKRTSNMQISHECGKNRSKKKHKDEGKKLKLQ